LAGRRAPGFPGLRLSVPLLTRLLSGFAGLLFGRLPINPQLRRDLTGEVRTLPLFLLACILSLQGVVAIMNRLRGSVLRAGRSLG
jgi:uncharacterized membrane protein HdeD (DUF308 family)